MQEAGGRRLDERTVDYGLAAMDFCKSLPRTAAGRHIADQLQRSAKYLLKKKGLLVQPEETSKSDSGE